MSSTHSAGEGDWFAIPLREGGYALGLIARSGPKGIGLLGYFFGPKLDSLPTMKNAEGLRRDNAVLVKIFGDLYLLKGKWPIVGHSLLWDRNAWPMPLFFRKDLISKKVVLVEYSEDDPLHEVGTRPCDPKEADKYPEDGISGAGAVEIRLTKLLL